MVAGDFLELYSICCQIHWDVNNLHIQFCRAIAAVPVQGQLNVSVAPLLVCQVGLKHGSSRRDFSTPSGKGQKMRSGAPNPAAAVQPGLRENAGRQWE